MNCSQGGRFAGVFWIEPRKELQGTCLLRRHAQLQTSEKRNLRYGWSTHSIKVDPARALPTGAVDCM